MKLFIIKPKYKDLKYINGCNKYLNQTEILIVAYIQRYEYIFIMGNQNSQNNEKQKQKPSMKKYVLELRQRDIVISYRDKVKLNIGDIIAFPNQYSSLHLWDAHIILARFIYLNKTIFTDKKVIQLLSGTGIGSIALKKYTKANSIVATDRHQQIIGNIKKNCVRNQLISGLTIAVLKWSQYKNYKKKFDIVIGADLLWKNCPVQLLIRAINRLMDIGSIFISIQPDRADDSQKFIQLVRDSGCFQIQKMSLLNEQYMESPLINQVQGFEEYGLIGDGKFIAIKLKKIKQNVDLLQQQKQQANIKDDIKDDRQEKQLQNSKQIEKVQKQNENIQNKQSDKIEIQNRQQNGQQQKQNEKQHQNQQKEHKLQQQNQNNQGYQQQQNKQGEVSDYNNQKHQNQDQRQSNQHNS